MKTLQWGETPFDILSQEVLLRYIHQMYSALVSAQAALRLCQGPNPQSGFWQQGPGRTALAKIEQILTPLDEQYDAEEIYAVFYRYADDLLFECETEPIGHHWCLCPECGQMLGQDAPGELVGQICQDVMPASRCLGELRKLQWDDLKKEEA